MGKAKGKVKAKAAGDIMGASPNIQAMVALSVLVGHWLIS
jgi:hypothetical protein